MAVETVQTHRVVELARLIEQDITQRRLQPGDPYLNTADVAQMLRVSKQAANQAMQLLAQRRVLDRRQRRGTCIAEQMPGDMRHPIESLLMLVHQSYLRSEGLLADGVVIGISRRLPTVNVQFAYTPSIDDGAFVQKIVRQCLRDRSPTGLLLVRSSLTAQRIVAESGLPAVIYGTPQPSVTTLSSIDSDQHETGRLLAEHVLSRGHQRLIVLMRDRMLPGDRPFQDGIREVAAKYKLPVDALVHRDLPADDAAIVSEVSQLLQRHGPQPGIVARSELLANSAMTAIKSTGLKVGDDVTVAIASLYRRGNENPPCCPYIRNLLGPQEQGEAIAQLLCDAAHHQKVAHERIPVELVGVEGAPD